MKKPAKLFLHIRKAGKTHSEEPIRVKGTQCSIFLLLLKCNFLAARSLEVIYKISKTMLMDSNIPVLSVMRAVL